jgi:predicted TIM-barrel fold metal-dependent hydrolase
MYTKSIMYDDFMLGAPRIDVHQHVWTPSLLDALAQRDRLPYVRQTDGLTVLHSAGEQPYLIDPAGESRARRAQLVAADGLDLALVALSSPIGIECLPRAEAEALIAAHLDGVAGLGERFAAWGPLPLDGPDPSDVDEVLARGCIGVSLPACALTGAKALSIMGPTLERVAEHGVPLFVHPGTSAQAELSDPLWWGALTDYVAQMNAAWLSFAALTRREHPDLTVLFAMLAGGAPLLSERLKARGGPPIELSDPRVFYDTSSYGPTAVEAMARRVGPDQLVYGSDRPVIEPFPTGRDVLLQHNAARILTPRPALTHV